MIFFIFDLNWLYSRFFRINCNRFFKIDCNRFWIFSQFFFFNQKIEWLINRLESTALKLECMSMLAITFTRKMVRTTKIRKLSLEHFLFDNFFYLPLHFQAEWLVYTDNQLYQKNGENKKTRKIDLETFFVWHFFCMSLNFRAGLLVYARNQHYQKSNKNEKIQKLSRPKWKIFLHEDFRCRPIV